MIRLNILLKLIIRGSLIVFSAFLVYQPLISFESLVFNVPILLSWPLLFLEPLSGYIRVSSQAPVVVIVANEYVDVPADEQENKIDKAAMNLVCCLNSHEFHARKDLVEA